jgi:hydroxypyruvate isomerase
VFNEVAFADRFAAAAAAGFRAVEFLFPYADPARRSPRGSAMPA